MHNNNILFFILILTIKALNCSSSSFAFHKIYRNISLDNGNYIVDWNVDFEKEEIEFSLTVNTIGFVGFGLNTHGSMHKADIIIGGVYSNNGTSYFTDRIGEGNFEPKIDTKQDWILLEAWENEGKTFLKFLRKLDTCDNEDIPIKEDTIRIIWAYDDSDSLKYHGFKRGSISVNLLDPPPPPVDLSKYNSFVISKRTIMPTKDTTYWCSLHKNPTFKQKQHIVAINYKLDKAEDLRHTHHFMISKCTAPKGKNVTEYFEPFLNIPEGGECYLPYNERLVPLDDCLTLVYDWSVGAGIVTFPENVGFIIGEEENEYYLLEVHLDNPSEISGLEIETGLTIYYTENLRKYDAELLTVIHKIEPSLLIPPDTQNFTIVGHCSSECTKQIPEEGVKIFNINLHSHLSGRKIKVRHFRNGEELPWLANDESYDFNFQEMRPVRNEILFLPGDHLSVECVYDSSWKKEPGVILGGFSTRDEMCETTIYYYPKSSLSLCLSYYPNEKLFKRFGIERVKMEHGKTDPTIILPQSMANKTFSQILNTKVNWTKELKDELQEELRFGDHLDSCGASLGEFSKNIQKKWTTYPKIKEAYNPINKCFIKSNSFGQNPIFILIIISLSIGILIFGIYKFRFKLFS